MFGVDFAWFLRPTRGRCATICFTTAARLSFIYAKAKTILDRTIRRTFARI